MSEVMLKCRAKVLPALADGRSQRTPPPPPLRRSSSHRVAHSDGRLKTYSDGASEGTPLRRNFSHRVVPLPTVDRRLTPTADRRLTPTADRRLNPTIHRKKRTLATHHLGTAAVQGANGLGGRNEKVATAQKVLQKGTAAVNRSETNPITGREAHASL